MSENKFIKNFRSFKIVQFIILFLLDVTFFAVILINPAISQHLMDNHVLSTVALLFWVLLVVNLACLLCDVIMIRTFLRESHDLNRLAYLDNLTGIPNRHGLDSIFKIYSTSSSIEKVGCAAFTISNLIPVNDKEGHQAGDKLIQDFSVILERVGDRFGSVGRNGGNEFLAILDNCSAKKMEDFIHMLEDEIATYNQSGRTPIEMRSAYVLNSSEQVSSMNQLLVLAYQKLNNQSAIG